MSVCTHTSSWRQLVAFAPLLIAAALVFGVLQGEPAILLSRNVYLVLVPLSLAGWWLAWRLARVLSDTPVTSVAQAKAGYVALRGKAQAMPNQPPLTSPSGTPCVWYHHSSETGTNSPGSYSATDTAQPFLLTDDSGQCIVLPAGADITGGQGAGTSERLIAAGDTIYVAGEFRPVSADTLQQLRDVEPEPERVSVSFTTDDATDMRAIRERGEQMLKEARAAKATAASNRSAPLALPVVCVPKDHSPFMISANKDGSNEGSWYRLLANANLVLLLGSGAMLSYLFWAGR